MFDYSLIGIIKLVRFTNQRSNVRTKGDRLFPIFARHRKFAHDLHTSGKIKVGFSVLGFVIDNDFSFTKNRFGQIAFDFFNIVKSIEFG